MIPAFWRRRPGAARAVAPASGGQDAGPGAGRSSFDPNSDLLLPIERRPQIKETLKRIKTNLLRGAEGSRVLVVTSATPGDGKSFFALNLAETFAADVDRRTLLIDADLRKPGLSRSLRPRPAAGLAEVLGQGVEWKLVLARLSTPPLAVLPGGAPPPDPVRLLSSARFRSLIEDLRREFQNIIVDTPPVVPFVDADIIGGVSDGAVLVVRSHWTPRSAYLRAVGSLGSTRVLGAVLNAATASLADRRGYADDYYYRYYNRDGERTKRRGDA